MIQLPAISLHPDALSQLQSWQQEIDRITDYADRVARAGSLFSARNTKGNVTFDRVRESLAQMCSGTRRCGYCEDSAADEVEHIRPKNLYPEMAFDWDNYLYACGPCNGPKSNRYALFQPGATNHIDVTRRRGHPVVPPPTGDPVLIDPRKENPLDFMELELRGTFYIRPIRTQSYRNKLRAQYTIKLLRLNDRDYLIEARRMAYGNYHARLEQYIQWRDRGNPVGRLITALQRCNHPTVWKEMQRQHTLLPDLRPLFRQAPEALSW